MAAAPLGVLPEELSMNSEAPLILQELVLLTLDLTTCVTPV
jgi:hypothetical protein